jgi:8-oxo-dGTP pyrophosphatase MutT (NUDIX family)
MLKLAVDTEELVHLHQQFGDAPHQQIRLEVDTPFLDGENQRLTSDERRAEICYVLHRGDPAEGVLLHRKVFYPEAAFRLPTGGIHQGESVLETLVREIEEETSFWLDLSKVLRVQQTAKAGGAPVTLQAFLGTLEYKLHHRSQVCTYHFATYHFLIVAPKDATPVTVDPAEQVAGWQWQPAYALRHVAEQLGRVGQSTPEWGDWGRFRSLSHQFVAESLLHL